MSDNELMCGQQHLDWWRLPHDAWAGTPGALWESSSRRRIVWCINSYDVICITNSATFNKVIITCDVITCQTAQRPNAVKHFSQKHFLCIQTTLTTADTNQIAFIRPINCNRRTKADTCARQHNDVTSCLLEW